MTGETVQLAPVDRHFADFIHRIDRHACDEIWLAAALASHAVGRGHICLDMEAAAGSVVASGTGGPVLKVPPAGLWRNLLQACDTIGRPGDYTPLVLDDAGRLYLHRTWSYECRVAEGLLRRTATVAGDPAQLEAGLERYFPTTRGEDAPDLQREAARAALTRRLAVVSGGPGTGKTATVARILALLVELSATPPRMLLATPTGKAAMRLRHSILRAADGLQLSDRQRSTLPAEVRTIHRLLGMNPDTGRCRYNRDNPLECDLLVVDEASMIDLPLMARLLEALPDDARLILLGDRDQLASVEAGAVLADICAGPEGGDARPADIAVVHLTRSYRFAAASGIGQLSRLINEGDGDSALELLVSGRCTELSWRPLPGPAGLAGALGEAVSSGYGDYVASSTPARALEQFECFRILSPLRQGPWGVENLNRISAAALGLNPGGQNREYRLQPLVISGNNYELGLFNGDTGVLLDEPAGGRLSAWFSDGEGGVRRMSPLRLPPSEPAFALTIHKSQGSEFERVLLILPDQAPELLTRELVYTAITRARSRVEIWSGEEVFRTAVSRRITRSSGLAARLWGRGE